MRIIDHPDFVESSPRVEICLKVIDILGPSYTPTHIVFDSYDYSQDCSVIDEFKCPAFVWTRDRPVDGVPVYFKELTADLSCTHLVWLSRKVLAYSELMFVWVLAHELRHVYQARMSFRKTEIRRLLQDLRRKAPYSFLRSSMLVPEEIDAEMSAMRLVEEMYGEDEVQQFLATNLLPRYPFPEYTSLLKEAVVALPQRRN
jgi:hypothetical protein